MTAALPLAGAAVTAWSITGTEPPRVYAWMLGLTLLMTAFARHHAHWQDENERRRRHEWDRRWDR